MFKIRVGKLYIRSINFNTYSSESSINFTADFDDAHEFNKDDYFYTEIIEKLLEIDNIELIGIVKEVDSNE